MVWPELAKDSVDLGLRQAFSRGEGAHDLGQYEAAAALPSRPLGDPAVAPERPQLPHFVGGRVPVGSGHDS